MTNTQYPISNTPLPKKFGQYGGQFVPETLMPALIELEQAYLEVRDDPVFQAELERLLKTYVGRPTPLTFAAAASRAAHVETNHLDVLRVQKTKCVGVASAVLADAVDEQDARARLLERMVPHR